MEVSAAEWKTRVDLAALYRLTALYHWDDLVFTHISMRVPGPGHHFLINPYGFLFEEITASSLVKVDLAGNIVMETPYFINPAGVMFGPDAKLDLKGSFVVSTADVVRLGQGSFNAAKPASSVLTSAAKLTV